MRRILAAVALAAAAIAVAAACGSETFVSADAGVEASAPIDASDERPLAPPADGGGGGVDACAGALFCQDFNASEAPGDGFSVVSVTSGGASALHLDAVQFVSPPKALALDVPVVDNAYFFLGKDVADAGAAPISLSFSYRVERFPSGANASVGIVRLVFGSDTNVAQLELVPDGAVTFKELTPTHLTTGGKLAPGTWTSVRLTLDPAGRRGALVVGKTETTLTLSSLAASSRLSRLELGAFWAPHNEHVVSAGYDDVVLGH